MSTITYIEGKYHVEGNTAHEVRELLDHYDIQGVHTRICGDNIHCVVLAITDERCAPRTFEQNNGKRTWATLELSAEELLREHRGW